jgi:hypothetical protein
MYLVVIAWLYVVLMMSVVEATGANGSLLGAIVTFILYGLLPLSLVVYLMLAPQRRKAIRELEASEEKVQGYTEPPVEVVEPKVCSGKAQGSPSDLPDAGGHATSTSQASGVTPMRKDPG